MSLSAEWMRYGDQNQYTGYVARLSGVEEPLPSVIILQEIWGVDDHIQDVTERLAKAGYVAIAPDLFASNGAREEVLGFERIAAAKRFMNAISPAAWRNPEARQAALSRLPEEQRQPITETLERIYNLGPYHQAYEEQTAATSAFLRETYAFSKGMGIASIGFCLGGTLSAKLAVMDPQLCGAVIYYGSPPRKEEIDAIQCPVLGLYGALDTRITDGVPAFARHMDAAGKSLEYRIYPDAPHAFFNDTRPSFHVRSARDSHVRVLNFCRRCSTEMAIHHAVIPGRTAVVVHELVHHYINPAAANYEPETEHVKANIRQLLTAARSAGMPVIFFSPELSVEQYGTDGAEIPEEFGPLGGDAVIRKVHNGGWHGSGLEPHLRELGIRCIILCGISLTGGVDPVLRNAYDRQFQVILAADATLTRSMKDQGWGALTGRQVEQVYYTVYANRFARVAATRDIVMEMEC